MNIVVVVILIACLLAGCGMVLPVKHATVEQPKCPPVSVVHKKTK